MMACLRMGCFTALSLSIVTGLPQQGGFSTRAQVRNFGGGIYGVGTGCWRVPEYPRPYRSIPILKVADHLYRQCGGASLSSQLWVPHLSFTVGG